VKFIKLLEDLFPKEYFKYKIGDYVFLEHKSTWVSYYPYARIIDIDKNFSLCYLVEGLDIISDNYIRKSKPFHVGQWDIKRLLTSNEIEKIKNIERIKDMKKYNL